MRMESLDLEYTRLNKTVCQTLQLATIQESELNTVSQVLFLAENNSNDNIKLMELNKEILDALNTGDSLAFKGKSHESVVLCTKNHTYEVREAETSNSLLLVPNLKFCNETKCKDEQRRIIEKRSINKIFHTYYEVRECKPMLEKLLISLEPSSFKGMEYESIIDPEMLYDWDRLQTEIQASDGELKQALNDNLIVKIDGYHRLISFETEVRSVTLMLDLLTDNSWELNEVNKEVTYESLKELIPKSVFNQLFNKYAEITEDRNKNGTQLYRYNDEKVCKLLAKVLLDAISVNKYEDFMESWKLCVPEKIIPKEEYLRGVAIITYNKSLMQKEVMSFLETNLPTTINERLTELFKVKDKWTLNEITPYVLKFATNQMDVNALLTKYTRCSKIKDKKYYSSKYGK